MSRKHKFWTHTGWSGSRGEETQKRATGEGVGGNTWKVLGWERSNIHCRDTDEMWGKEANLQAVEKRHRQWNAKALGKKLKAGVREPVSQFTVMTLDAAGSG